MKTQCPYYIITDMIRQKYTRTTQKSSVLLYTNLNFVSAEVKVEFILMKCMSVKLSDSSVAYCCKKNLCKFGIKIRKLYAHLSRWRVSHISR